MANRYDDLTVSGYTPQTMQELAFVPMMKREKHDKTLADLELIRSGLAKVDPYSKHFDEALRLKKDIESQIDNTSSELAKQGINNDMIGKTIAMNRKYQDLIAPTGAIGQINAEKQNILKINDEYDKYGQQKGWSEAETSYWKNKALEDYNSAPVYDEKGRLVRYSGPKEIANKVDYNKRLHELAASAGMTTEAFKQGMPLAVGQDESGYFTQGHKTTGWSKGSNEPQVIAAYNTLIKELNDPTSELRKSAEYERRNLNSLSDILGTQSNIYLKDSKSNESDYTIDHFGSGPESSSESSSGDIYGEDYNTQEVGGNTQDYSEIERIGKTTNTKIGEVEGNGFSPVDAGSGAVATEIKQGGKKFNSEDIKDPRQKALYNSVWSKMINEGVVGLDGKKHFIKADYKKLGKNNPANAKAVLKMLKEMPAITLTSKIVTTDTVLNNSGFSSSIGKTADERDKTMRKQLKLTNSGARRLLDPKTGKVITFEEAKEKYNLKGPDNVNYHGYISPLNWEENSFNGTNSKASPHVITAEDENGNFIEFKTSRLNSDNAGINIDRYNDLNENYRNWTINHNNFVPFKSKSKSLSKLKVKYNTKNPKVDPKRGLLNYEVLDSQGNPHYMTEAEFINTVNRTR
jgi:hypothetical protein